MSQYIESPTVRFLTKLGVSPNAITILGMVGAAASAILISINLLAIGGLLFLLTSIFDMFDGALARNTGKVSKFGALFDSTIDRISETLVLLGLLIHFIVTKSDPGIVLVYLTLASSILVSYIRARAGGLNVNCEVGVMTRPERIISIGVGLIIGHWWPFATLIVLAIIVILTIITLLQRMRHVFHTLAEQDRK